MPNAFQLGGAIGGNVMGGMQKGLEMRGIDKLLERVNQSKDPDEINNAMNMVMQHVSPQNREGAIAVLQNKMGQIEKKKTIQASSMIANQIEAMDPKNPMYKMAAGIYRTDLPMKDKHEMVKNLGGSTLYKSAQQDRLDKDSVTRRYNQKIKELDTQIKGSIGNEQVRLKIERDALTNVRDEMVGFTDIINEIAESKELDQAIAKNSPKKKEKWNPKKQPHKRRRNELMALLKNDENRVGQILSKEYE